MTEKIIIMKKMDESSSKAAFNVIEMEECQ